MSDELLKFRIEAAELRMGKIQRELDDLKEKHEQAQRSWLTRGIGALLFVLTTLIGVMWSYRGEIFK